MTASLCQTCHAFVPRASMQLCDRCSELERLRTENAEMRREVAALEQVAEERRTRAKRAEESLAKLLTDSGIDFDAELKYLRGQGPDPWKKQPGAGLSDEELSLVWKREAVSFRTTSECLRAVANAARAELARQLLSDEAALAMREKIELDNASEARRGIAAALRACGVEVDP